jgi:uncharacterized membrane protein
VSRKSINVLIFIAAYVVVWNIVDAWEGRDDATPSEEIQMERERARRAERAADERARRETPEVDRAEEPQRAPDEDAVVAAEEPSADPALPKAPPPTAASSAVDFSCAGTEPFWSLRLLPGRASYLTPEIPKPLDMRGEMTARDDGVVTFESRGIELTATITPQSCRSEMVDAPDAPFSIELQSPDGPRTGCCVIGEGPVFVEGGERI